MDNCVSPLSQRELDILFAYLKPVLVSLASDISEAALSLDYVTLTISGHRYKVGISSISESPFVDNHYIISIPCEVKNE